MAVKINRSFRGTHSLQPLHSGRGRARNDIQFRPAPMGGHLMAAGRGIVLRSNGLKKHLPGREPQTEAKGLIAVVGKKPVVARAQKLSRSNQYRFMPRSADLKIDLDRKSVV